MCDPIQCHSCGSSQFNGVLVCNNCGAKLYGPTTGFRESVGIHSPPYDSTHRLIEPQSHHFRSYPSPTYTVSGYSPGPKAYQVAPPPQQVYYNQPSQTGSRSTQTPDRAPGAILTLIFSILGCLSLVAFIVRDFQMLYFGVYWIVAFIAGIITLVNIKKWGYKKGKGFAIIGIVLGVIVIILTPWHLWVSNNAMHAGGLGKEPYLWWNSTPTFADLDNDGDLDLIIGEWDGNLDYFKNTGTPSNPIWTEDITLFVGIDVGKYSAPEFADLNNDGALDLIIGERDGNLNYFENTGTLSNPIWTEDTSMFLGIDVGSNSTPAFADLDNDGDRDLDLIIGEWDGNLNYFKNTGTPSNPIWTEDTSMFAGIDVNDSSTPSFADLDNDGDLDLIIGECHGNLNYYKNSGTASDPVWTKETLMFEGVI